MAYDWSCNANVGFNCINIYKGKVNFGHPVFSDITAL